MARMLACAAVALVATVSVEAFGNSQTYNLHKTNCHLVQPKAGAPPRACAGKCPVVAAHTKAICLKKGMVQGAQCCEWKPYNTSTHAHPPMKPHATCKDQAWEDADGNNCRVYKAKKWCSKSGTHQGTGYNKGWGKQYAGAIKACCACGGGTITKPTKPTGPAKLYKKACDEDNRVVPHRFNSQHQAMAVCKSHKACTGVYAATCVKGPYYVCGQPTDPATHGHGHGHVSTGGMRGVGPMIKTMRPTQDMATTDVVAMDGNGMVTTMDGGMPLLGGRRLQRGAMCDPDAISTGGPTDAPADGSTDGAPTDVAMDGGGMVTTMDGNVNQNVRPMDGIMARPMDGVMTRPMDGVMLGGRRLQAQCPTGQSCKRMGDRGTCVPTSMLGGRGGRGGARGGSRGGKPPSHGARPDGVYTSSVAGCVFPYVANTKVAPMNKPLTMQLRGGR